MSTGGQATAPHSWPSQPAGPTPTSGSELSAVCIANISPHERRKRLAAGGSQFVMSLAVLAVLLATRAKRWWRLPLGLLFWGAAVGFFQWREKT